jgi:hypothetical protein
VKYPYTAIFKDIVENFEEFRLAVKTDEQIFIIGIGVVLVNKTIVLALVERHFYIFLAHIVVKSGRDETYANFHT